MAKPRVSETSINELVTEIGETTVVSLESYQPSPLMLDRVRQRLRQRTGQQLVNWLLTHQDAIYAVQLLEPQDETETQLQMACVARITRVWPEDW